MILLPAGAWAMGCGGQGQADCGPTVRDGHAGGHADHGSAGMGRSSKVNAPIIQALGLDDAQRRQVDGILSARQRAARELGAKLEQRNRELYQLTHSPTLDQARLRAVTQDLAGLYAQCLQTSATAQQQLYGVLSPAQRQRLSQQDARLMTAGAGCPHGGSGLGRDMAHSQCVASGSLMVGAQQAATGSAGARRAATDAAYTCSMHPQIQSDKPGECPLCGMDLVVKEAG